MKILCLNVWNGGKLKEEIVEFLDRFGPSYAVMCFQEASAPFEEIRSRFPEYAVYAERKVRADRGADDQCTLVHASLSVIDHGTLCGGDDFVGFGQWVTIAHTSGPLTIINFHGTAHPWDKYDTPERLAASEEIMRCASEHSPAIIMGDFNLRETSESVAMFSKHGFRNLIDEYNVHTTRNHHAWDLYPDNILLHSDYVFVSNEIQVVDFEVMPDIVSDHQPLVLGIS